MNKITAVLRYDQTATLRAVYYTTLFRIKSAETQSANILFGSDLAYFAPLRLVTIPYTERLRSTKVLLTNGWRAFTAAYNGAFSASGK